MSNCWWGVIGKAKAKKAIGKMNKYYSHKEVAGSLCEAWTGIREFEGSSKWRVLPSCLKTGVFQRVAVSWEGINVYIASAVKAYSTVSLAEAFEYSICVHVGDSYGNVFGAMEVVAPKGILNVNVDLPLFGEAKYWRFPGFPDGDSFLFYEQGKLTETPSAFQDGAAAERFIEAFCQRVSDALINQGFAVVSVVDETSLDRVQDRLIRLIS